MHYRLSGMTHQIYNILENKRLCKNLCDAFVSYNDTSVIQRNTQIKQHTTASSSNDNMAKKVICITVIYH
ncbi:hypothetical protein Plhal304r1_c042g0121651 [Plasmopara halstedii]